MAKPSFEQSLHELELIVNQLEQGHLTLDEALNHFEQGIKLSKQCQHTLKKAEQKIEQLTQTSEDPDKA